MSCLHWLNASIFPLPAASRSRARNRTIHSPSNIYDENKMVGDKTMKDHLRFAACYWHTFCSKGSDPFGGDTQVFEWDDASDEISAAKQKQDAAFEFFTKLGVPYWCFHDIDMAPDADDVATYEKNLVHHG